MGVQAAAVRCKRPFCSPPSAGTNDGSGDEHLFDGIRFFLIGFEGDIVSQVRPRHPHASYSHFAFAACLSACLRRLAWFVPPANKFQRRPCAVPFGDGAACRRRRQDVGQWVHARGRVQPLLRELDVQIGKSVTYIYILC